VGTQWERYREHTLDIYFNKLYYLFPRSHSLAIFLSDTIETMRIPIDNDASFNAGEQWERGNIDNNRFILLVNSVPTVVPPWWNNMKNPRARNESKGTH